jgi:hypothetical protein
MMPVPAPLTACECVSRVRTLAGDAALPNVPAAAVNQESRAIDRQTVVALKGAIGALPNSFVRPPRASQGGLIDPGVQSEPVP